MDLFTVNTPISPAVPIVANIPHSGLKIPANIAQHLSQAYLPNQDWHLDKLYDFLPQLGVTVMQANYSRYVVDLNRELKEPIAGNFWSSVVPLQTAFDQAIYQDNHSLEDIQNRIQKYYLPYHQKLENLLKEKVQEFGKVYLLDLHSFGGLIDDQICLGNSNGKSCKDFLMLTVESSFTDSNYQVVKNKVFTGGYITRFYSQISGVEALQIELKYPVYLDKNQLDKPQFPDWDIPHFHQAKDKFRDVFAKITSSLKG
ncbi:N-formylglutamate amidohydrolase [Nostoc sp. CMAA1605]|uniref:N-formylglutamate amidohydrolase n=1 Tax=Nostoc sp. CMAA1605 TaxID=2055159 RepID=UPI001F3D4614|nr:N-formylglutamate amidohydrolase [Nostoc sp. CMAA1605]MCF4969199.1 N-formylglutamate amidohydrolase [Nostoc sp. CMAA1605]